MMDELPKDPFMLMSFVNMKLRDYYSDLDELCADLGIKTAFLLDGGGSAEMVNLNGDSYKTVNKPSDGSSRTVVNTVIIAYGPKK